MPKTSLKKWKKYVEGCKHKDFFDNVRSLKVKTCPEKIVIRTTRDSSQRILGGGNKIKGQLQTLINGLSNIPKKALRRWAKTVQDTKDKKLFDGARSAKLQLSLVRILRRTMKEAHERVKGLMFASPQVKGIIKRMDGILKRKPKEAFDRWRKYVQAVNNNEVLDGIKSQKLLNSLSKVTRRTLRDATQRIVGEGSKVKGAVRKIYSAMQKMPKIALEK